MINMGYCRFHNTKLALDECLQAIRDGKKPSEPEMDAMKDMFQTFLDFCLDSGIIEDNDETMQNRLEEFFETIGDEAYWN